MKEIMKLNDRNKNSETFTEKFTAIRNKKILEIFFISDGCVQNK